MQKAYKYFSADVMELVFQRDGYCGIKCSLPKDYNDPYELFLGMDLKVSPEYLATYNDIIQGIPQLPTTCFSKSPIVAPMWAHYAMVHTGFVLEFDIEELKKSFEGCMFKEVSYKSKPSEDLRKFVARASVVKKPRHAVWLEQAVFLEAYFSKYLEWSYEQECRLVVMGSEITEKVDSQEILFIPFSCLTSIIFGNKCLPDKIKYGTEITQQSNCSCYKIEIGKSYPVPYMSSPSKSVFIFKGSEIIQPENICESCSEPVVGDLELCPWCSITDQNKLDAAMGNPFRMMERYGLLEEYLEGVRKIDKPE